MSKHFVYIFEVCGVCMKIVPYEFKNRSCLEKEKEPSLLLLTWQGFIATAVHLCQGPVVDRPHPLSNRKHASRCFCHRPVLWLHGAVQVVYGRLRVLWAVVVVMVGDEWRHAGGLPDLVDDCVRVVHVDGRRRMRRPRAKRRRFSK